LVSKRYTVIIVPAEDGWVSAMVPSMPGCVSQGRSRDEALAHVREAIEAWVEVEAEHGRTPLAETADLVLEAVGAAMHIIDDMRLAGELPGAPGYDLELTTVELEQPIAA
jgi:predicted RNase H-like HicB family nuclease